MGTPPSTRWICLIKMNYLISQSRNDLKVAHISDKIKDRLLSELNAQYYHILSIMSKIFDDTPSLEHLDIVFTIEDDTIIIKSAIINNDHFSNVSTIFEKNGFQYESL